MLRCAVLSVVLSSFVSLPAQSYLQGFGGLSFDSRDESIRDFQDLALGEWHVVARRSNGSLRAWGYDRAGQCGVATLAGAPVVALAAGSEHTLALRADGTIAAIGNDTYGQCSPPALPPGVTWTKVAAYGARSLGLRSDGIVEQWGAWSPLQPVPGFTNAVDLGIGSQHALMLLADGRVFAWGGNNFAGEQNVPPLPPGLVYTAATGGAQVTLLLRSDGAILAFGNNNNGQCNVPTLPPGVTWLEVHAFENRVVGRRSDGQVVTWGNAAAPVPPPPPGVSYTKVALGWTFAALRSDGGITLWPDGDFNPRSQRFAPAHPAGFEYRQIAAGGAWAFAGGGGHTLALDAQGGVAGWGNNIDGQANVPPAGAGLAWVELAAGCDHTVNIGGDILGSGHSLLRRSDGSVFACGNNRSGQCNVPALVDCVELAAGGQHSLLRRANGSIVAVGNNGSGQCTVPALPPGTTWVEIAAGFAHSLARRSDGAVVAFGANGSGQCNVPALPPGTSWVQIGAGRAHSAGLRSDGVLVCWGDNAHGQCNVPTLRPGESYVEVAVGGLHTVARRADGNVVAFGKSVADFDGAAQTNAQLPPAGLTAVEIAAGGDHSVVRLGPARSYVRIGQGCAGSRPAARLVPRDTPAIGSTFRARLSELPVDAAIVLTGLDASNGPFGPLPLALASLGMPGCTAFVRNDAATFVLGSGGVAALELAIPAAPTLVGVSFWQQALVLDPQAGNTLGAVMSDAMRGTIGKP